MTRSEHEAVIVIAASAGGVFALETLIGALPPDLPAPVLIALHLNPCRSSSIVKVLSRRTSLPVSTPEEGEPIRNGHIYIAPPNRHMIVDGARIRLSCAPREHHHRPAADPLFRSAAAAFGARVIGVVLTGGGDDGSQGIIAIKSHGGRTIAQRPQDARMRFMPANAVATGCIDHTLSLERIAAALENMIRGEPVVEVAPSPSPSQDCRVLVVEDEYLLAAEIETMLHDLGCQVVGPVASAVEGIQQLRDSEVHIDCALLDVNLDGTPVYPLAEALRMARVPIVFATGYGSAALEPEWRNATRLQKPFDLRALQNALSSRIALPARPRNAPPSSHIVGGADEEMRRSRSHRMVTRARLANSSTGAAPVLVRPRPDPTPR